MDQADILVVGAGIAGASAAYELAASAAVFLLEREAQPGYHTTGRSAAVFAPTYGNRVIRLLTAASEAFFRADAGGLADHPVLGPRGELLIARADQLAALDQLLADLGTQASALERLNAAAVIKRVPALRPDHSVAGIYDPSALDLDVAAIHQGYLRGFRRRGGRVMADAEVRSLRRAQGLWQADTVAGRFAAPILVNAAGAWADQLAVLAGIRPVSLVPKRRTAFVFDPGQPIEPTWPAVCDIEEQFYFKPESGLLLGSPADETPMAPCDVQPEELDVAIAIDRIERATQFRIRQVRRKWAGLRTFAADRTPVVGLDDDQPGFCWLAGQGGYGIQTAPALGRAVVSLLAAGDLPPDLRARGLHATDLAPARLRIEPRPSYSQ